MSTLASESDFFREFEEFQHKKAAAIRLTWFAFQDETDRLLRIARPFASNGQSDRPANTDETLWVKDADDPQRWRPIKGQDRRRQISLALWYYFDVLRERMIPHIRRNWKVVAALARRYSASDSLLKEAHSAPMEIFALNRGHNSLAFLCEIWDRPNDAAVFKTWFAEMFVREFEKLRCEVELESESELPSRPQPSTVGMRTTETIESAEEVDVENAETRERKRLIREAVKQRLEGRKYCAFLDRNGLATSQRLQQQGCPPTYAAAYKSGKKFRKSIQDEKTKVGKPSSRN